MDNYSIKRVTFGGFDKQDVIRYIEQAAEAADAAQKELQEQNDALRSEKEALQAQLAALTEEVSSLKQEIETLSPDRARLQESLSRESTQRQELEVLKSAAAEAERLRPDAEAYAQFRERLGAIECDARKRASDLELATVARMQEMIDLFREQYQALMCTFESTANHVNGELRKVEVNLTQLPRALDRSDAELQELLRRLETLRETYQQS